MDNRRDADMGGYYDYGASISFDEMVKVQDYFNDTLSNIIEIIEIEKLRKLYHTRMMKILNGDIW